MTYLKSPLLGVTVVTLEHAIAAPLCTRHLADLGARVIKIERPDGGDFARDYDTRVDGESAVFVWLNRSKQSVVLDVKSTEGRRALDSLIAKADVFVQNLAPGATARMGLSYETLHKSLPRLIVCDISGYGGDGPYRDKKAYDLLIQSEAGLLSMTGTDAETCRAGISIADISAGMYAYSSIMAALLQRQQDGEGAYLDVSMLEGMAEWMSYPLNYTYKGAPQPVRTGSGHATVYPYGVFLAGDGTEVMLGLQNSREWTTFCEVVLERPDLVADSRYASNPSRVENREALRNLIDDVFSGLDGQALLSRLDQAQIANAKVNSMADVWAHPQLAARRRWSTVMTASGAVQALIPPGMHPSSVASFGPVPALGEHTDEVLREIESRTAC